MSFRMWIIAGFVLMAVVAAAGGYFAVAKRQTSLAVGGRQLKLEVVKSPWQLQRGLSGRDDLPPDSGMLFIMPHRGIYSFWMKDMKFALDIVWLDDGLVVDLATLPAPTSTAYIPRHDPVIKADRVLELKAGMAQKFGLKPGVRLVLPD